MFSAVPLQMATRHMARIPPLSLLVLLAAAVVLTDHIEAHSLKQIPTAKPLPRHKPRPALKSAASTAAAAAANSVSSNATTTTPPGPTVPKIKVITDNATLSKLPPLDPSKKLSHTKVPLTASKAERAATSASSRLAGANTRTQTGGARTASTANAESGRNVRQRFSNTSVIWQGKPYSLASLLAGLRQQKTQDTVSSKLASASAAASAASSTGTDGAQPVNLLSGECIMTINQQYGILSSVGAAYRVVLDTGKFN